MTMNETRLAAIPAEYRPMALLVEKAMAGDRSVIDELRRALENEPALARIGNLATVAEDNLIETMSGENLLLSEALRRRIALVRAQLAPSTPLEHLLVDRIVVCYLQVGLADSDFHRMEGDRTAIDLRRKRLDSANGRYLRAMNCLATIRSRLREPKRAKRPASPAS